MSTLYMGTDKKTVSDMVIFSGDPWRVEVLRKYLDNPQKIAFLREFNTYTGTYKGVRISVSSTGIGAPSAAIAMEEMYESGMKVAIRMGTVMSLVDDKLGQFIIPVGTVRREKTSSTYVEQGYPAIADFDLVTVMNQTVESFGREHLNGVTCSLDGFYSQIHDSKLSRERGVDMDNTFRQLKAMKVCGVDMESSCMLTVGRLMGVKTAVVLMVTVLENLKKSLKEQERIDAEDLLCRVVLEGLYRYKEQEKTNDK